MCRELRPPILCQPLPTQPQSFETGEPEVKPLLLTCAVFHADKTLPPPYH